MKTYLKVGVNIEDGKTVPYIYSVVGNFNLTYTEDLIAYIYDYCSQQDDWWNGDTFEESEGYADLTLEMYIENCNNQREVVFKVLEDYYHDLI